HCGHPRARPPPRLTRPVITGNAQASEVGGIDHRGAPRVRRAQRPRPFLVSMGKTYVVTSGRLTFEIARMQRNTTRRESPPFRPKGCRANPPRRGEVPPPRTAPL